MRRKWRLIPTRKTILLRVSERLTQKQIPHDKAVRNDKTLGDRQLSRSAPNSRCGNHLEILWEATIDGIYAALYGCKVSRTVGFALVRFRLD